MVNRTTQLIRVKNNIINELLKHKKKGETYSDVLNKYMKLKNI